MQGVATLRFARVSAQKARLVANLVRGASVEEAVRQLSFLDKKTAPILAKLINSAVANITAKAASKELDIDDVFVSKIEVNQGPSMRRFRPRAQGRATPIHKKTSHITVQVEQK
jgi:large subunit ribosomal protein L22